MENYPIYRVSCSEDLIIYTIMGIKTKDKKYEFKKPIKMRKFKNRKAFIRLDELNIVVPVVDDVYTGIQDSLEYFANQFLKVKEDLTVLMKNENTEISHNIDRETLSKWKFLNRNITEKEKV